MTLTQLARGGNVSIQPAVEAESSQFRVEIHWAGDIAQTPSVDAVAFCLTSSGKVRKETDMIFFNNRQSENEGLVMAEPEGDPRGSRCQPFLLSLDKVPEDIQRIVFSVVIDSGAGGVLRVGELSELAMGVRGVTSEEEIVHCDFNMPDAFETALIMGEVYRRNGEWKVKSVGQGYGSGLSAMAEGYGVTVAPGAQAVTAGAAGMQGQEQTSAGKSSAPGVRIDPPHGGFGEFLVDLTWGQPAGSIQPPPPPPKKKGLLGSLLQNKKSGQKEADLDLCCLYELADGYRGVVQALGNRFGAYNSAPFIELLGDERKTDAKNTTRKETVRINGRSWGEIKRILVFAMIFEGPPDWASAQAKATIRIPEQVPISVRLNQNTTRDRACSVALIENDGGQLVVHKRVEMFKNPRELDRFYEWGLQWAAGMKD